MMDPQTAYFLKKYYRNVIKWWLVMYNPEAIPIWHSKEETAAARLKAANTKESQTSENELTTTDESAYNATTGSYSGLYGKAPIDSATQSALDAIMSLSNSQNSIDSLFASNTCTDIEIPPEQDDIIAEANAIYERLLREAQEDEAKKQAEIESARQLANNG